MNKNNIAVVDNLSSTDLIKMVKKNEEKEELKPSSQLIKRLQLDNILHSSTDKTGFAHFILILSDKDGIKYAAELICKGHYEESVKKYFGRLAGVPLKLTHKPKEETKTTNEE